MGFFSCINKLFLVVLNFMIFAVGVGVVSLASVVIHRSSQYGELLADGVFTLPIWVLIVGILITIIGFFGCCGAMKENTCMLYTYGTIVLVLFVAEITLGILVAIYPEEAKGYVKDGLEEAFEKYNKNGDDSLKKAIDATQHDLECCGVNGPSDWNDKFTPPIPQSCCRSDPNCNTSGSGTIFTRGCFEAIVENLRGVTIALGVASIVLAIIQIACIFISCGLARKNQEYV